MKSKKLRKNKIITRKLTKLSGGKKSLKIGQLGGQGLTNNNRSTLAMNVLQAEGVKYKSKLNKVASKSLSNAESLMPYGIHGSHSSADGGEVSAMISLGILAPPIILGTIGLTSKLLSGIWKIATFKNVKNGFNIKVIKKEIINKLIENGKLPPNFKSLSSKERAEAEENINLDSLVNDTVEYYKKIDAEAKILGKEKLKQRQDERAEKDKAKQLKIEDTQRRKNAGETTVKGRFKKSFTTEKEIMKKDAKSVVTDKSGSRSRNFADVKSTTSNYWKRITGEDTDTCSLIKDKIGLERASDRKALIDRRTGNHPFFKEEDSYFKSLVGKNMQTFCFNTNANKDVEYYSRFCRNILNCMKTPKLINGLLFEAIDSKSTKRMFDELPGYYNPSDNLQSLGEDMEMNLKKRIVKRIMEENKEIQSETDPKQRYAMILSVLQNENKKNLATFFTNVLIKSVIEYKEASSSPPSSYTKEIKLQEPLEKLITKLTKKYDMKNPTKNANANANKKKQSGGSSSEYKPMSLAELKKIGAEELYEGMLRCTTNELIKSEHEDSIVSGNIFSDGDLEIDGLAEGLESPKLLYIVIGSLALVSLIELGLFDAPECLTHTFI
jgi:hypothetical protein